jgi:hypothetical protein
MANQSKLKAWVRYDGTGRVISGGPIFQVNKPKVGNWKQIDANLCCNNGSTTTTTTAGGGGTPTAFIQSYYFNTFNACYSTLDGNLLFYSAATTIQAGITIFTDASLTIPVTAGFVISTQPQPMQYVNYLVGANGLLSLFVCPSMINANGAFTQYDACNGPGTSLTLYYTGSLGVGTALFTDVALTTPYNPGSFPSGNGTYLRLYFQADDQVCTMSGNMIQSYTACSGITTTTTTTQAPALSFIGRGGSTSAQACGAGNNETFYTTGPFQAEIYPQTGNIIYFDQAMTQLVTYAYISLPGIGAVFQCTNGVLSNMSPCQ